MAFTLMGIPIEFDLSFFIVMGVIGWLPSQPIVVSLTLIAALTLSVLWHELGHAVAFKSYGHDPRIRLSMLFGMAYSTSKRELTLGPNVIVALAGPAAMFLLAGAAWVGGHSLPPFGTPYWLWLLVRHLVWVNVFLGILNLLPMLPLDGGHVMRCLLEMRFPRTGVKIAQAVSVAVAAGAVLLSVMHDLRLTAMMSLLFGAMNFAALRRSSGSR